MSGSAGNWPVFICPLGHFQTRRLIKLVSNRLLLIKLKYAGPSLTKMIFLQLQSAVDEESVWTTQTWNLLESANLDMFVDGDMSKKLITNAILLLEQSNGFAYIQAAAKLKYVYCQRKPLLPIAEYLALPYQRPVKNFLMELRMDSAAPRRSRKI